MPWLTVIFGAAVHASVVPRREQMEQNQWRFLTNDAQQKTQDMMTMKLQKFAF